MLDKIRASIEAADYESARNLLEEYKKTTVRYDDVLSILEAAVCEGTEDWTGFYESVSKGLACNGKNYELYFMLGNYYAPIHPDKAFLCYENAMFYCKNKDAVVIEEFCQKLTAENQIHVKPVSIIILSYNGLKMTQECIKTIFENCPPESFELIVVDNASTDGCAEWLSSLTGVKVLLNRENRGFPAGCNQGIKLSEKENDILLLNNDTLVPPNMLFWLRMGLYETEKVGSAGAVSNGGVHYQGVDKEGITEKNYLKAAAEYQIPMLFPFEKRTWLVGYAVLIKRSALNEAGPLDERFTPGNFEDNDLGWRIGLLGYEQHLCKNSFVFHYGTKSFRRESKEFARLLEVNEQKFTDKWKLHPSRYSYIKKEMLSMLPEPGFEQYRILEIGCGTGETLTRLRKLYPNAILCGIEKEPLAAKLAAGVETVWNIEAGRMEEKLIKAEYDYILLGGILEHLEKPEEILTKLKEYLKPDGKLIGTVHNAMHISVIAQLLRGKLAYKETGIIKAEHIHFFTAEEIVSLLSNQGYEVQNFSFCRKNDKYKGTLTAEEKETQKQLLQMEHIADASLFENYQYVFMAESVKSCTWI